jgi:hypothetical protein
MKTNFKQKAFLPFSPWSLLTLDSWSDANVRFCAIAGLTNKLANRWGWETFMGANGLDSRKWDQTRTTQMSIMNQELREIYIGIYCVISFYLLCC